MTNNIDNIGDVPFQIETIQGYPVEYLISLASLCEEYGLTPEDAMQALDNAGRLMDLIYDEQQRVADAIIRKMIDGEYNI